MSRTNYGRIENGLVPYDQDVLELAGEALGCDLPDILMRNPKEDPSMWTIWDRIPKENRDIAAKILKAFLEKPKTGTDD